MNIVCADSVLHGLDAFSALGQVVRIPDRDICRDHLTNAQVLIVRSKTHVNCDLLEGTPVEFVATATAGADHFDIPWLNEAGIAWTASPGCNANAVAEYTLTAMALLARKQAAPLPGKTLGIIGVGQVGSRVAQKAPLLGLKPLRNDPPLALKTSSPEFLPLKAVLNQTDILTLHTPLTIGGPFPTRHLADCRLFEQLRPGTWLVNTSRGEVVDPDALHYVLDHHRIAACALDVWENEPELPPALFDAVDFLTPHIAGYTLEGLLNGTLNCHRELCHYLEVEPTWTPDPRQLPPAPFLHLDAAHRTDEEALTDLLTAACPIPEDDRAWRSQMTTPDPTELRRRFDHFRKTYTGRREFAAIRVHFAHASSALLDAAAALDFQVCTHQA